MSPQRPQRHWRSREYYSNTLDNGNGIRISGGSAEESINKISNHVLIRYTGIPLRVAFFMHRIELYPEEQIT